MLESLWRSQDVHAGGLWSRRLPGAGVEDVAVRGWGFRVWGLGFLGLRVGLRFISGSLGLGLSLNPEP